MEFLIRHSLTLIFSLLIARFSQGQPGTINYTISTFISPPWLFEDKVDGNETEYAGFIKDLIDLLANDIGFNYAIVPAPDNEVGSLQKSDGSWSGAIGEVANQRADFAAAPIGISDQLRRAVDLTYPFMSTSRKIVLQMPTSHPTSIIMLLHPFSYEIWILIVIVNLAVGGLLYLINKFSPSEWSRVPADKDPTGAKDSFNAQNSFFFVHSTLTMQGYKEVPRSPAGRIVTACWFSFCLFMIIAYIAGLASLIIAKNTHPAKPVIPFKTYQQMLSQTEVKYGVMGSKNIYSEMKNSNDDMIRNLFNQMNQNLFTSSVKDSLNKIRNSDGSIAGIVDVHEAGYNAPTTDACDLVFVGEQGILPEQYGLACQKDSSLCNSLSSSILELRENGDLHQITSKWFSKNTCPRDNSGSYTSAQEVTLLSFHPLTIAETAIAWIILLLGIVLSAVLLLVEVCIYKRKSKKSFSPQSQGQAIRNTADEDGDDAGGDMGEKAPIAAGEP